MSVAKMKDGKRWYVFIRYKDWDGTTRQHKKEGFARRADAQQYERDFIDRKTGSISMTVNSMYKIYMDDCKTRLKPTTLCSKKSLFESHIMSYLGNLKIDEVKPSTIRKWQNDIINLDFSQTYLKGLNSQVSALFNYAVKYYGLERNPVKIAGSIGKANAEKINFWTIKEFEVFINVIKDKPTAHLCMNILFWTGMRKGEMLALTKSDIDLKNKTISINKTFARVNMVNIIQEPKTPKSNRVVSIPQFLVDMLDNYMNKLYSLNDDDRLFPYGTEYCRNIIRRGCDKSGVKRIRVHDLRHSHASMLIEMGYSPILIAERLGHENVKTTLQTYSHLYPNKQEELASAMHNLRNCYDFATQ